MSRRKDADGLTPMRRKFVEEYIKCGNASEAYRRSFSAKNMKDTVVQQNASKLLRDNHVSIMIRKLTAKTVAKAEKKLDISIETTINDLNDAMRFAKECGNPGALVSAVVARAKVLGHVIDKKEITTISQSIEELSEDELDELIDTIDEGLCSDEEAEQPDEEEA
jgi:hypothetical protein